MRGSAIREFLGSYLFLGIVLFGFSVGFPPFDDQTTLDLSFHMLEHVMILVSAVMIGYYFFRRGLFSNLGRTSAPKLGLLAVVALIAFWHLPDAWDAAILNPAVHAIEHLSFLLIGFLIGSLLQSLSAYSKVNALVLAFFAHMVYGIILISPLSIRVYPLYSIAQQSSLGTVILAPGPAYWVGVVYLLARNRTWFQETARPDDRPVRATRFSKADGPRRLMTASLSLLLILVLVGYYGTTVAAISLPSAQQQPHSSTVYIVETLISWQFSPQRITVVLGINNTVTWASRSISYDTVTGTNGAFSSGPIAPGATFTHTFSQPGEYEYKCLYHPWMAGRVTVAAAPSH